MRPWVPLVRRLRRIVAGGARAISGRRRPGPLLEEPAAVVSEVASGTVTLAVDPVGSQRAGQDDRRHERRDAAEHGAQNQATANATAQTPTVMARRRR